MFYKRKISLQRSIKYSPWPDHFFIKGVFKKNEKSIDISCAFSTTTKKTLSENGKEYTRFSEHIGKYPLVLVAPMTASLSVKEER